MGAVGCEQAKAGSLIPGLARVLSPERMQLCYNWETVFTFILISLGKLLNVHENRKNSKDGQLDPYVCPSQLHSICSSPSYLLFPPRR